MLCLLGALSAALPVYAQEAPSVSQPVDIEARNTTIARALFDEGLHYVDAEQWENAQDRFGRVLALRYSAVAAYNWGLALARLGRGVVAASALRRLLTDVNLDPKVHEHASALLVDVESRFAWLNVRVLGDCQGCEVLLEDQPWPAPALGVYVPVDAGKYALRLRLGNSILSEQRLTIAEKERLEATLAAGDAASLVVGGQGPVSPGEPLPMPGPAPAPTPARASLLRNAWFWGAVGVLALGAAGIVVIGTH
jgi:hypothetical protein